MTPLDLLEDAAALLSLGLFLACVAVWSGTFAGVW